MRIVLQLISGMAWAYAYWRIIRVSRSDQSYGMPLFAATLNFTWELIYFAGGMIYWSQYGFDTHLQTAINGVWLLLDIGIIVAILRYGSNEFAYLSHSSFNLLFMNAILIAFLFQASILLEFRPETASTFSAFLQNAYMSGAFVVMAIVRKNGRAQRLDIGVAQLIGTLAPTLSTGLISGVWPAMLLLGITCLMLDTAYLVVFKRLQQAHIAALSPNRL